MCGRSAAAHLPKQQGIKIYFQGKLWEFANWEEARKQGFYLIQ